MDWDKLKLSSSCQIPFLRHFYQKYLPVSGSQTFVEVGAFDGDTWSNTSGLADLGWQGVYIEPHPEYAKRCRARHPSQRIKVVQCAITACVKEVKLIDKGSLTTASTLTDLAYKDIEWSRGVTSRGEFTVKGYPLQHVLNEVGVPKFFELLVVDVEGFEEEVFNSFSLKEWRPRMMIVELNDLHVSFSSMAALQYSSKRTRDYIIASGYYQVYADAINSVFVSSDYLLTS
jgi:FkbM family methyltransferase